MSFGSSCFHKRAEYGSNLEIIKTTHSGLVSFVFNGLADFPYRRFSNFLKTYCRIQPKLLNSFNTWYFRMMCYHTNAASRLEPLKAPFSGLENCLELPDAA